MPPTSVTFPCPQCGVTVEVSQVQGDLCPSCGFEFKWFQAGEERTAHDYLAILTGSTHLVALPGDEGFIVAHE
ncbi:MAG: hypothetical protein K0Q72_1157 [Armatimonadetes bacterium]|nr:hypothetical protein [Armatimonadota bacterium]